MNLPSHKAQQPYTHAAQNPIIQEFSLTPHSQNSSHCRERQPLGEDVGELGSHRHVEDTNVLDGNALVDKVKINLNMLGVLVLNGVSGEVDGAGIIVVDQSGLR
jgi:hypothetical protein